MSSGPSVARVQRAFGDPELEALGAGADRRQRIVDLVHHARGERADGRQLLGLRKARFGLAPLGDVFADRDDVRDFTSFDVHRNLRDAIGARLAERLRLDRELLHLPVSNTSSNSLRSSSAGCRCKISKIVRPIASSRDTPCSPVSRFAIPRLNAIGAVDHVQTDGKRIDDLFGEASLLVDLARSRRRPPTRGGARTRRREAPARAGRRPRRETPRPRRRAFGQAAPTRRRAPDGRRATARRRRRRGPGRRRGEGALRPRKRRCRRSRRPMRDAGRRHHEARGWRERRRARSRPRRGCRA